MTDELDDLIPEPEARVSTADISASLVPVAQQLMEGLWRVERFVPDRATPQERTEMLALRALLLSIKAPIEVQLDIIDLAYRRAAAETGAKQFLLASGGAIKVEQAQGSYRVQEQALRDALLALATEGLISKEEVDDAIAVEVSYKPNHTKLNALAANRGDRVRIAIEKHRVKSDPSPLAAKVRYPQGDRR